MFLSAVAIFQCTDTFFQIFLISCFNFLTSCSVLSVVVGVLLLLANYNEQNRTEQNRTEQNRTEQNRTEQNRTES
jgi:ABC-type protease/lipase transport system fused ATPase/permease subunit